MKYTILLLFAIVMCSCEKGEELFYEDDVCKISSHQSWTSYKNDDGNYDFKFGLNSFTDLTRVYMDSCAIETASVNYENASFSYIEVVEVEEDGEMKEEYIEKELVGISCDESGYISGDIKTGIISVPMIPGTEELPTGYVFFRFILDNEASSDTLDFLTRLR